MKIDEKNFAKPGGSIATAAGESSPVFITGLHKSGTTWLALLLSHHPEIYVNYEAGFLDHQELLSSPERRLENQPDDASLERELRGLLDRWAGRPWNHWIEGVDRVAVETAILRSAVELIATAAVQRFKPEATRWVDKTPRTAISKIREYFPYARVIYLMRDPRDRAISLYYHCLRTEPWVVDAETGLRRLKWEELFLSWADDVSTNEKYFTEPWCRMIRYEDLLARPHQEVGKLLDFLGVENDPGAVAHLIEEASFQRLSGGRQSGSEDRTSFYRKGVSGDWRNFESPADLEPYWRICLASAATYGYTE